MKRRDFIAALAAAPAVPIVADHMNRWGEDLMRLDIAGSKVASIETRQR